MNKNLVAAAKEFNLTVSGLSEDGSRKPARDDDAVLQETLGVWNGEEFVFNQALGGGRWQSWWSNAKLLYRYGFAPIRTLNLMKKVVGHFLDMYDAPHFPFADLSQAAYDVGLTAVTAATGEQYLRENNIGDLFAREIVQASTRVNYAQNLGEIHGLEAMVCMATDGAMSVEGGNWRIFEGMAERAGAEVVLGMEVRGVRRKEDGRFSLGVEEVDGTLPAASPSGDSTSVVSSSTSNVTAPTDTTFDEIIIAAPYHQTSLTFFPPLDHIPDDIPYVNLHVTIFSTHLPLSPNFFNLPANSHVPTIILTTLPPSHPPSHRGPNEKTRNAAQHAHFFSISLVRTIPPSASPSGQREHVYKIFSPDPISPSFLRALLDLAGPDSSSSSSTFDEPAATTDKDITWVHRKLWQSYPYSPPRVTFERIALDEGVWYTGGIEGFISTMETSSLMGMNVARLVVDGWIGVGGMEGTGDGEGRGVWKGDEESRIGDLTGTEGI